MRDTLIAAFEAMDLSQKGAFGNLIDSLKAQGWKFEHTYYVSCQSLYEKIWEHEETKNHNASLRQVDILESRFLTLYELSEDNRDLSIEPFYFSVGRIGNTKEFMITPPATA